MSFSLEKIIRAALTEISKLFSPDITVLFLVHKEKLILKDAIYNEQTIPEHFETPLHKIGECLCGIAAKNNKAIFCENIREDPRYTWIECKKAGIFSMAALPLRARGQVLGILGIGTVQPRAFHSQKEFLETIASEIGNGLNNVLIYEET